MCYGQLGRSALPAEARRRAISQVRATVVVPFAGVVDCGGGLRPRRETDFELQHVHGAGVLRDHEPLSDSNETW